MNMEKQVLKLFEWELQCQKKQLLNEVHEIVKELDSVNKALLERKTND